jgi:hypothetical protein
LSTRVVVAFMALILGGCGGSPTTPPKNVATLIGGTQQLDPNFGIIRTFTVPNAGQLDVTVTWGAASNTVWVEVGPDTCTFNDFVNSTCQLTTFNRDPAATPSKKVTVASFPAGFYALFFEAELEIRAIEELPVVGTWRREEGAKFCAVDRRAGVLSNAL